MVMVVCCGVCTDGGTCYNVMVSIMYTLPF